MNPFPPGARVCAYLRDSGHEDQDLSTDQQETRIRAWCLENGLLLTTLYTDAAAPGSTTIGRDQFLAMIHAFRTPGCPEAGLVVWKYNRFARDIDDSQFYKADLRRRGYIIHSLNDTVPAGLDGRLFEAAIDWMNARYLEDLSTDIKRGQHHNLAAYGAIGGIPPRGFIRQTIKLPSRRDGSTHIVHRWVPDPELADRVRQAFSMRAAGSSYAQIHKACRLYRSSSTLADPAHPAVPAILRGIITRITLDVVDSGKTITGIIEYIDPLNAYKASYDALYPSDFYAYTLCPRPAANYTLKFT